MEKGDNKLLLAVTLLERVRSQLKSSTRVQVKRSELEIIKQTVTQALEQLNNISSEQISIYLKANLIVVIETIDSLLSDESYSETDLITRDMLAEKIEDTLGKLYIVAGKYYTKHDFIYNVRMIPLLNRIIDVCIDNGYYFEEDLNL